LVVKLTFQDEMGAQYMYGQISRTRISCTGLIEISLLSLSPFRLDQGPCRRDGPNFFGADSAFNVCC